MATEARVRGGDKSSRAVLRARQARVFAAVTQGRTAAAIQAQEHISADAFEDDMRAINERLTEWAAEQQNKALAYAIAQYQRVIDEAWRCHALELKTERRWLMKRYDRVVQLPAMDGGTVDERKPPPYKSAKGQYLQVIVQATAALCKVAGLDSSTVHHTGVTFGDLLALASDEADSRKGLRVVR